MARPQSKPHPPAIPARQISLFLDIDGTLVDLAERPDGVHVDRALISLIERLMLRLSGRVSLLSGRSIAQLDDMLGKRDVTVAGSHGAEIRLAGSVAPLIDRPHALDIVEAELIEAFRSHAGIIIEVKTLGVAVHYRQDPQAGPAVHTVVRALGRKHGLEVQKGKMMTELRTKGHDKGTALSTIMQHSVFAGHMPVFIGDDVTDEDGFKAAAALGGAGILVGPHRQSFAEYRLENVAAVRHWLSSL